MSTIAFVLAPDLCQSMPHLGIAYLRSSVEKNGHQTAYFDFAAEFTGKTLLASVFVAWRKLYAPETIMKTLFAYLSSVIYYFEPPANLDPSHKALLLFLKAESNDMARRVMQCQPDFVCFTIYDDTIFFSLSIAKAIKEINPKIRIIFGGPFLIDTRVQDFISAYDSYVNIIVEGEGEYVINDILSGEVNNSNGIIKSESIKGIDDIAFPAYHDCDFELYGRNLSPGGSRYGIRFFGEKALPIISARGCPYNCTFCNHNVVWKKYRERNINNIIKEIIHDQEKYDCHIFRFNDSLLNADAVRLRDLCEAILDFKLQIYWYGYFRADKMDSDLAKLMYRAGCRYVWYGVESASDRVLCLMNKQITSEEIEKAINATREASLKVRTSFIYAYPGETLNDLRTTASFITKMAPKINVIKMYPFAFMHGALMEKNPNQFNITLHYFKEPEVLLNEALSKMPETWSHPEISEEEIERRKEFIMPIVGKSNQKNNQCLPYLFSDAVREKLKANTELAFVGNPALKAEEVLCGDMVRIAFTHVNIKMIIVSKEFYDKLVKEKLFTYDSLLMTAKALNACSDNQAAELIIGLISLGLVCMQK